MAVTTKILFPATSNSTTTDFSLSGLQLNNADDLDVYVTKTTAGIAANNNKRILHFRQSTSSNVDANHKQVNNTDGLYFPAITHTGGTETLENYTLVTANSIVRFNSALPSGAIVFVERRTRDADSAYTSFASGSTIRAADLNNSSTESNFTAQEARNKALTIEGAIFNGKTISSNYITSDNIVNGTIQTADIGADQITGALIPDDTINSEHYAAGSIDTEHIGNQQVTTAKLDNDAVTSAKIGDDQINSEHYAAGSIDLEHMSANSVDSDQYVDGSIDHVHLAADIIDGDNIQDDVVNSEHIAAGALDNEHYAAGSITSDKLNAATVITSSEQGSATTNDTSFLTSAAADARFFNISTGDTIKNGDTFPDNDTTIATTAAINDRIIDLVDDVGGFVPIANETSFPTSNPDVNNGTGTLVSIKSLSSTHTPSSGTVTIANGAGTGNTVSITGCGSTVLTAGFGVIVETTGTLHTYAFHRLVPKATEVTTVAGVASNVTTVAGIAANTTTVAGIASNVTTVAGIASDVTAVAGNATNITAVKNNETNINSVQSNATNINTVAGSISNVNTAATNIASINNASANISSVNNFGDQYQVAANNPSTDGGGNALAAGDLYFNTSANELKIYNGSAWQAGVTATGNFALTTGNTFTGDNRYNDGVKALFGTGSDLEIYHSGVHGYIKNSTGNLHLDGNGEINLRPSSNPTENGLKVIGNGGVELYHNNVKKFEATSTGATVTGNITVSGNVDGRDVAADGTKLDGIETAATADQTASEIVSLLSDQNIATTGTLGSGNLTVTGTIPSITLTDSDHNPDFQILANVGNFTIKDVTNNASRIYIEPSGTINLANNVNALAGLDVTGAITATGTIDGRDVAADGTKLDGIESGATADQTGAEIKTAYEAESDTNAFTDALLTKLNGIETSATADQTASEILTLIKTVDGTGSGLDADTLEGVEGANYLRSNIGDTFEGNVLNISSTDNDCLNFTGSATSLFRGIAFNNKTALSTSATDPWLRLNAQSEFTNGVYTPLLIRADGGFQVDGTTVIDGSANVIGARVSGTVANATRAENLGGYTAATTGNNARIVRTHSSGYIYANYFNTTANDVSSGVTKIMVETGNDNFIRHGSAAAVKSFLFDDGGISVNQGTVNLATNSSGAVVSRNVSGSDVQFQVTNFANHANSDAILRIKTQSGSAHCRLQFGDAGNNDTGLIDYDHANNDMTFSCNGVQQYEMDGGAFHPIPDNARDLGRSGNRWDDVRATNTGIVSQSDRNVKNTIVESDLGLDFVNKLKPVSYKLNSGKSGRTHYGLISQDIEELLSDFSKTPMDFAGFCKDTLTVDTDMNELETPKVEYSLRYTEFISPMIKAIQELSAKVAALEAA